MVVNWRKLYLKMVQVATAPSRQHVKKTSSNISTRFGMSLGSDSEARAQSLYLTKLDQARTKARRKFLFKSLNSSNVINFSGSK